MIGAHSPAFRLAAVLKLREAARNELRYRLAELQRAADAELEVIRTCDRELVEAARSCAASADRPVDLVRCREQEQFARALRADRRQAEERRGALAGQIERSREALVAADRDVRLLERLREREAARRNVVEQRVEQRRLDEATALAMQSRRRAA